MADTKMEIIMLDFARNHFFISHVSTRRKFWINTRLGFSLKSNSFMVHRKISLLPNTRQHHVSLLRQSISASTETIYASSYSVSGKDQLCFVSNAWPCHAYYWLPG